MHCTLALADYARGKKIAQICYFTCFIVPLGAKPLPTLSVHVLVYSIWWSEALLWRYPFFSHWQPAAGLTNRVLVRDSHQAGTSLTQVLCICHGAASTNLFHGDRDHA